MVTDESRKVSLPSAEISWSSEGRQVLRCKTPSVVGLPGETLQITSGDVYIDGRRFDEPYAVGKTHPDLGPYAIAEGTYLCPRGYAMGEGGQPRLRSRSPRANRGKDRT